MRKMKITIHRDGTQQVEVLDGHGPDCKEWTRELEVRLGTQIGERVLKPEYDEETAEIERIREVER